MSELHVSVVTVSYNRRNKLLSLARDLAKQDYDSDRCELVAVDDAGTDRTAESLRSLAASLPYRVVALRRDRAGAYLSALLWNDAIAHTDPRSQVFVQVADVRVRPDFIRRHAVWHADDTLRLVTGAKFEGDELAWDLSSCRRSRLAGLGGVAAVIQTWTACWGRACHTVGGSLSW